MNKIIYFIFVFLHIGFVDYFFNSTIYARGSCEEFPAAVDSSHYFTWNSSLQVWEPNTVQLYEFTNFGKVEMYESIDANSRAPLTKRYYYYDSDAKLIETISYRWINNEWEYLQNVIYSRNPDGKEIIETIYNWLGGEWQLYGRIINYYENDRRVGYTGQLVNKQTQELYDYGYFFINYTGFGKISEWYGLKASDGSWIFNRIYYYNEKNRLVERHIYSPAGSELQLNTRNLYFYNSFNLHSETINQKPTDDCWENTGRYVYYHRINNAFKVAICHNGRTICVSKNAVSAHLAHGDVLGACPSEKKSTGKKSMSLGQKTEEEQLSEVGIRIYPNPVRDEINISLGNNVNLISKITLLDISGRVQYQIPVNMETHIVFPRGSLQPGIYLIRMEGESVVNYKVIIE